MCVGPRGCLMSIFRCKHQTVSGLQTRVVEVVVVIQWPWLDCGGGGGTTVMSNSHPSCVFLLDKGTIEVILLFFAEKDADSSSRDHTSPVAVK